METAFSDYYSKKNNPNSSPKPKRKVAPNEQEDDIQPLQGKSVLIVDTALATRRTLQEQCSELGARSVAFASSVSEVLHQLESREIELILCEYALEGERNGQQLLEELRLRKVLPWRAAFVLVTAERVYSNVVSCVEFEPDDYLVKPFTVSTLSKRIAKLFYKKKSLRKIYDHLDEENYDVIPKVANVLITEFPQYANELERIAINSMFNAGKFEEAKKAIEAAMENNPRPWMEVLHAKILMQQKKFDEAEAILSLVVRQNPEYISATDVYSEVLWEQNKPEEALQALENLGARSMASTTRLRKLADLAVRLGDDTRSKTYLNKVIERSKNSSLTQMHDYLQLSKIFIKEGRHDEAEKLTSKLKNVVDSSELNFARNMMKIQKLTSDGSLTRAKEKLQELFENDKDMISRLESDARTSLLEQCFIVGMSKEGYALASQISKQKTNKSILDRIKFAMHGEKKEDKTNDN